MDGVGKLFEMENTWEMVLKLYHKQPTKHGMGKKDYVKDRTKHLINSLILLWREENRYLVHVVDTRHKKASVL